MRYVFRQHSLRGEKAYRCSCGRCVRRRKKFWQTENPFNKTKDGAVKTREDIYAELRAQIKAWVAAPPEPCAHVPKEAA